MERPPRRRRTSQEDSFPGAFVDRMGRTHAEDDTQAPMDPSPSAAANTQLHGFVSATSRTYDQSPYQDYLGVRRRSALDSTSLHAPTRTYHGHPTPAASNEVNSTARRHLAVPEVGRANDDIHNPWYLFPPYRQSVTGLSSPAPMRRDYGHLPNSGAQRSSPPASGRLEPQRTTHHEVSSAQYYARSPLQSAPLGSLHTGLSFDDEYRPVYRQPLQSGSDAPPTYQPIAAHESYHSTPGLGYVPNMGSSSLPLQSADGLVPSYHTPEVDFSQFAPTGLGFMSGDHQSLRFTGRYRPRAPQGTSTASPDLGFSQAPVQHVDPAAADYSHPYNRFTGRRGIESPAMRPAMSAGIRIDGELYHAHPSAAPVPKLISKDAFLAAIQPATMEADDICPICYGSYEEVVKLPCGHTYCNECIQTWLNTKNTCPMDRSVLFEQPQPQLQQRHATYYRIPASHRSQFQNASPHLSQLQENWTADWNLGTAQTTNMQRPRHLNESHDTTTRHSQEPVGWTTTALFNGANGSEGGDRNLTALAAAIRDRPLLRFGASREDVRPATLEGSARSHRMEFPLVAPVALRQLLPQEGEYASEIQRWRSELYRRNNMAVSR